VFGATLIAHAAFPAPVVFTSEGLFARAWAQYSARTGSRTIERARRAETPSSTWGSPPQAASASRQSCRSSSARARSATIHVVPNQGHIHLYLDGSIVAMTGLQTSLSVSPGRHTLRAEFVASDHGPFRPPVLTEVTFEVQPRRGAA